MIKIVQNLLFIILPLFCYSQNNKPFMQSDPSMSLQRYLMGVKYAEILTTPEKEKFLLLSTLHSAIYLGVLDYFSDMGFEKVGFSGKFRDVNLESECFKTRILLTFELSPQGDYIDNFAFMFITCNADIYVFKMEERIKFKSIHNIRNKIHSACIELYGLKKKPFDKYYRLELEGKSSAYNEEKMINYFDNNKIGPFEGIYERRVSDKNHSKYKVGLIKNHVGYDLIYLDGANNYLDWKEGDIKAILYPTATPNLFKADWFMADKTENNDYLITFEQGLMNVIDESNLEDDYIKLYPRRASSSSEFFGKNSGTGFAIASNGYIVTNYHVIENAKNIRVRGVNNDFSKSLRAKLVSVDKNNDLAIIVISDINFKSISSIPFSLTNKISDVGTSVFVLGYPLRATMGDEVKLTSGIISSKSGFLDDITSYQISAPVQPGNSGGPLFDYDGNIIGIINAKHAGAENVSYAIKSSYLNNLLDQLPSAVLLKSNYLKGKSLSEQVKLVKEFVYIIEIE